MRGNWFLGVIGILEEFKFRVSESHSENFAGNEINSGK
jgi:hypothetical protein